MDIYSELKSAQLDNLASDPTPGVKGRVYHKSTTEPIKVDDGVTVHKVLTDQMYPEIRNSLANYSSTPSSGSFSTVSTTYVDVTNLSVTITSTGKPIEIFLFSGYLGAYNPTGAHAVSFFQLDRNGVGVVTNHQLKAAYISNVEPHIFVPSSCIRFIDTMPAGTYTYKFQAKSLTPDTVTSVVNCFMMAKEF